ncbi:Por secretion system C-terminal sorting domain-containing protein [Dyadobacter koreensis]|uniref:Por secretion system C-terminal sorting domain-containing protein n=1 Tax=Dyadobacter koreensis TaxID=408657 RepID=A0A1H6V430_9BACT|nr:M43 family zinc metalloprotease [Dyadobacter koreensis]SEI95042.1 Por secretion system C-terminal sorting domain-containing protein [Dyadobacter koreensis]
MKNQNSNRKVFIIVALLGIFIPGSAFAQIADSLLIRCVTHERELYKEKHSPGLQRDRINTENAIQEFLKNNRSQLRIGALNEVIRIPVVVHVVHNRRDGLIGGLDNPNITNEQIRSQIAVLNEDYRRKANTRGFNSDPVGVDTGIEFFLAEFDENGKSTTGITRTQYLTKDGFNPITDDQLLSSLVYWPSDKYLNIWVCRLTGTYLGIAQFPSVEGIDGLNTRNENYERTDGAIIDFRYFGRNAAANSSQIYNLGRTTTHEIGHWLGLIHIWGDAVCGNDFCDDTPPAEGSNQTSVCTDKYSNCSGFRTRNMIENYMDYSPDSCMNIFTGDQLGRIRAVLELSPRRKKLVESAKEGRLDPSENLVVEVFPNPASEEVNANIRFADFQNFSLSIYDQRGNRLETQEYNDVWSRRVTLDINKFNTGLYFFKVTTDKETVTRRFVIK